MKNVNIWINIFTCIYIFIEIYWGERERDQGIGNEMRPSFPVFQIATQSWWCMLTSHYILGMLLCFENLQSRYQRWKIWMESTTGLPLCSMLWDWSKKAGRKTGMYTTCSVLTVYNFIGVCHRYFSLPFPGPISTVSSALMFLWKVYFVSCVLWRYEDTPDSVLHSLVSVIDFVIDTGRKSQQERHSPGIVWMLSKVILSSPVESVTERLMTRVDANVFSTWGKVWCFGYHDMEPWVELMSWKVE
jgi:hypothetical protein